MPPGKGWGGPGVWYSWAQVLDDGAGGGGGGMPGTLFSLVRGSHPKKGTTPPWPVHRLGRYTPNPDS